MLRDEFRQLSINGDSPRLSACICGCILLKGLVSIGSRGWAIGQNRKNAMRACIQRVSEARVTVDGEVTGQIGRGLVVLLGIAQGDGQPEARWLAEKCVGLRVFEDDAGKMNRSLDEVGGAMLVVSQFTLLGDCRKGRRPSFVGAAEPESAEALYEQFVSHVRAQGIEVATGRFRASMQVALVNDGPVTLWIDTMERGGREQGAGSEV
jgi:D-tyrosyl-tRNA(Tyr) deacylase